MDEFFVIKRVKCPRIDVADDSATCHLCDGLGYIETKVPLTDALAGDPVVRGCLRAVVNNAQISVEGEIGD